MVLVSYEDFGFILFEVVVFGVLSVVFCGGGFFDIVVEGVMGVFFDELMVEFVWVVIDWSEMIDWDVVLIRWYVVWFLELVFVDIVFGIVVEIVEWVWVLR